MIRFQIKPDELNCCCIFTIFMALLEVILAVLLMETTKLNIIFC